MKKGTVDGAPAAAGSTIKKKDDGKGTLEKAENPQTSEAKKRKACATDAPKEKQKKKLRTSRERSYY